MKAYRSKKRPAAAVKKTKKATKPVVTSRTKEKSMEQPEFARILVTRFAGRIPSKLGESLLSHTMNNTAVSPATALTPVMVQEVIPTAIAVEVISVLSEAIAQRAYELFEARQRTGSAGDAVGDWLQAEHELLGDQSD